MYPNMTDSILDSQHENSQNPRGNFHYCSIFCVERFHLKYRCRSDVTVKRAKGIFLNTRVRKKSSLAVYKRITDNPFR